jgi:hypothetical protein
MIHLLLLPLVHLWQRRHRRVALGNNTLSIVAHESRIQPPLPQIVLGIVEYLPRLRGVRIRRPHVARHHGRVVQQLQQPQAVARQDDLLLGALDGG